jgi:hypothetical protein
MHERQAGKCVVKEEEQEETETTTTTMMMMMKFDIVFKQTHYWGIFFFFNPLHIVVVVVSSEKFSYMHGMLILISLEHFIEFSRLVYLYPISTPSERERFCCKFVRHSSGGRKMKCLSLHTRKCFSPANKLVNNSKSHTPTTSCQHHHDLQHPSSKSHLQPSTIYT